MFKFSLQFTLYLINQIILIYSKQEEPASKPKSWTPQKLYKYLNETYLHRNNPNYDMNLKYMIFDPEYYVNYDDVQVSNDILKILSDKYNFSCHIFLISKMKSKHNREQDYLNFVDILSYYIRKDHENYNDNLTLTAVLFLKDKKMRIKTTDKLRKKFNDNEILNLLNRRQKDLEESNFKEMVNGLVREIFKIYQRKSENPNVIIILAYTMLFIIGFTIIIIILNRESPNPNDNKIYLFLDKLKKKKNYKEIFNESCIICLDNFKTIEELKKFEDSEKKEFIENEEILECGHKFHKKCISEWMKKEKKCPICRMELDKDKNDNNDINKQNEGEDNTFNNILKNIIKIQNERNYLNEIELKKIKKIYNLN